MCFACNCVPGAQSASVEGSQQTMRNRMWGLGVLRMLAVEVGSASKLASVAIMLPFNYRSGALNNSSQSLKRCASIVQSYSEAPFAVPDYRCLA